MSEEARIHPYRGDDDGIRSWPTNANDAVMERFGYRICPECNADMPADQFVGPLCQYCGGDEFRE